MRITPDFLKYTAPMAVAAGSYTAWFAGEDFEILLNNVAVWQGSGIKRLSFTAGNDFTLAVACDNVVLYKLPRKEIAVGYGLPSYTVIEPARQRIAPEILLMMENQRRNAAKREEMLLAEMARIKAAK